LLLANVLDAAELDAVQDKADKYEIQNLVVALAVDAHSFLQLDPADSGMYQRDPTNEEQGNSCANSRAR